MMTWSVFQLSFVSSESLQGLRSKSWKTPHKQSLHFDIYNFISFASQPFQPSIELLSILGIFYHSLVPSRTSRAFKNFYLVSSDVSELDFHKLSQAGHLLSQAKPCWPSFKNEQNTSWIFLHNELTLVFFLKKILILGSFA